MPCPCQTNGKTPCTDCPRCAEKHIGLAFAYLTETGYEQAGAAAGELAAAEKHLATGDAERRALAARVRALRHMVQARGAGPWGTAFSALFRDLDRIIRAELARAGHGSARERADALPAVNPARALPADSTAPLAALPLLVPLAYRPGNPDEELRLLLRSAVANARNLGEIVIALSGPPPAWLREGLGLRTLRVEGADGGNKDANIARKLLALFEAVGGEEVVWCADDNVFLHPVDLATFPLARTRRTLTALRAKPGLGKWQERLFATLEAFPVYAEGGDYDAHAPQRLPRERAISALRTVPWDEPPGRTVGTALVATCWPGGHAPSAPAESLKETAEDGDAAMTVPLSHVFLGYNDAAATALLPRLRKRFPDPSPWESAP